MPTTASAVAVKTPTAAMAANAMISFLRNVSPPASTPARFHGGPACLLHFYFLHFSEIGDLIVSPVVKWKSPSAFQVPAHFLGVMISEIFFLPFLIVFLGVFVSTVPTD